MSDLTVLTITDYPDHAPRFLQRAADLATRLGADYVEWDGTGAGLLENVLDGAVASCRDGWILLLADDEAIPRETEAWIATGEWETADNWCFPRRHLWPDEYSFITSMPLWPDLQTRLSVKAKSGGRLHIHAGSPFGSGTLVRAPIDHHKFLVRTQQERQQLLDRYATFDPIAVSPHYAAFSIPEHLANLELAVIEMPQLTQPV